VGSGELDELEELLASDAVVYSDGGGKHRAALRAIVGRSNIIKFIRGVRKRTALHEVTLIEANGLPAAMVAMDDRVELVTVEVRDHKIKAIFGISNPDKLSYLDHQLANRG
jgi:RNA polymerase sigma-70 factor (ECF subfamily)